MEHYCYNQVKDKNPQKYICDIQCSDCKRFEKVSRVSKQLLERKINVKDKCKRKDFLKQLDDLKQENNIQEWDYRIYFDEKQVLLYYVTYEDHDIHDEHNTFVAEITGRLTIDSGILPKYEYKKSIQ